MSIPYLILIRRPQGALGRLIARVRLSNPVETQQGITCPSCGTLNEPGSVYCRSCGVKLAQLPSAPSAQWTHCPHCGNQLPSLYGSHCPSCGAFLTSYATAPTQAQGQPVQLRQAGSPPYGTWTPNDGVALSKIRAYGIIGLAGGIMSLLSILVLPNLNYFSLLSTAGPNTKIGIAAVAEMIGYLAVSVSISFLSFYYLRRGFRSLSAVDSNFRSPLSNSFMLYFALLTIYPGIGLFILFDTAASPTTTLLAILAAFPLLIVGIVTGIIGLIGLLQGIWRFGLRYSEGLFKVAAIFTIIPVPLVSSILILIGTRSVENRLEGHIPPAQ